MSIVEFVSRSLIIIVLGSITVSVPGKILAVNRPLIMNRNHRYFLLFIFSTMLAVIYLGVLAFISKICEEVWWI